VLGLYFKAKSTSISYEQEVLSEKEQLDDPAAFVHI
jgi:regulatory protein YycI of two-component signal transduction system YycFG